MITQTLKIFEATEKLPPLEKIELAGAGNLAPLDSKHGVLRYSLMSLFHKDKIRKEIESE